MRRTLAGLLFGLAYLCASLTVAGFLLQRTAFDPGYTADHADVVLDDPQIQAELVNVIAGSLAAQAQAAGLTDPSLTEQALRDRVTLVAGTAPGAALMADIIHDVHAVLIGEQEGPVVITPEQLVDATQNQAAAVAQPIEVPVETVGALDVADGVLGWLVPIAAIATLALVVLGLAAHPERSALFRSLGLGLLVLALLAALLGYVVPKFLVPVLSDSPWARIPATLADDSLPLLVALDLLLVGGALALLAGTGIMRRRKRWSTPVNTYRYQEERRWSG
ncbi:MAG: hypothetical protein ACOYMR_18105 [Ilumatobacteraceae bacterium]